MQVERAGFVTQTEIMLTWVAFHTMTKKPSAALAEVGAGGAVALVNLPTGGVAPDQA